MVGQSGNFRVDQRWRISFAIATDTQANVQSMYAIYMHTVRTKSHVRSKKVKVCNNIILFRSKFDFSHLYSVFLEPYHHSNVLLERFILLFLESVSTINSLFGTDLYKDFLNLVHVFRCDHLFFWVNI